MALARALLSGAPTVADVVQAAVAVEAVEAVSSGMDVHRLRADLFVAASRVAKKANSAPVLGVGFESHALRFAAEKELRTCARMADSDDDRFVLVDQANAIRPLTLF
jgi:hypothetical protein